MRVVTSTEPIITAMIMGIITRSMALECAAATPRPIDRASSVSWSTA